MHNLLVLNIKLEGKDKLDPSLSKSKKKFIGILGGTFDPPHEGHRLISNHALLKLNLQEVWWIVTSKNPLKENSTRYKRRLTLAKKFNKSRRIKVVEIDENKNFFAIDTIFYLKKKFKTNNFVWIMGADNTVNLHLWKKWKDFFYNIPIAIFDRPSYSLNITNSKALFFFRKARIKNNYKTNLKLMTPPKWIFISGLKNHQSSSFIRKVNEN